MARLGLAVALFAAMSSASYWAALALFVSAAATDWLDGFWARRFGQVTRLGRILDPLADKVVVCGAFIYLAAAPGSGVAPWMSVVVTCRELLVTALRGLVEQSGGDFSARFAGKAKMVLQSVAVAAALLVLATGVATGPAWRLAQVAVWAAVAATVYSGIVYARLAAGMSRL